ncbi:MAG: site-2 protease family protein [Candidatus Falkowbacteria bacterium]
MIVITILFVLALLGSAIFHEYAHGLMAKYLGDHTAEDAGRLTLNPIPHLDPIGSVLLPLIMVLSNTGFFFAWAKPVPYNPYNLRDQKFGDLKVALAGPGSNLILAIFFGMMTRLIPLSTGEKMDMAMNFFSNNYDALSSQLAGSFSASLLALSLVFCFVNLSLMVFNLVPIPPLDGSKILLTFLSARGRMLYHQYSMYGFIVLFGLIFLGAFNLLVYPILYLFSLLSGLSFF